MSSDIIQHIPMAGQLAQPLSRALIIAAESPSKVTQVRPISNANCIALRQAKTSNSAIKLPRKVGTESAPITAPLLSRITTPKPVELDTKVA